MANRAKPLHGGRRPNPRQTKPVSAAVDRRDDSLPIAKASVADAMADRLASLTPRERTVLEMYTEFCNDKLVAQRLSVSHSTVRNQLAAIEHKLGAKSREELVKFVVSNRG